MWQPSKQLLDRLRSTYTAGTRVELIRMDDAYSNLKPGDKGTVITVDDMATIHVSWDCGSSLGVAYGSDLCKPISDTDK